jgi:inner membrane protein
MDNVTHTLVGAALAHAGLKKRTALASATLMIGANFPDVDVVAVFFPNSVHWRRGHTHGFLALLILPFVLAGIMRLWDRHVRLRRDPSLPPAEFRQLWILSAVAIATHPTLDFMNTYGMRWLMPFLNKWFYADGLFIVDVWILLALGFGVYLSRRNGRPSAARGALAFLAVYTMANLIVTGVGRRVVDDALPEGRSVPLEAEARARTFMVAPVALVPWRRDVIVDDGKSHRFGAWTLGGRLVLSAPVPKGEDHPAVALAKRDRDVQRFLIWARFPSYQVSQDREGVVVRIVDQRYGADWASIAVRLP